MIHLVGVSLSPCMMCNKATQKWIRDANYMVVFVKEVNTLDNVAWINIHIYAV